MNTSLMRPYLKLLTFICALSFVSITYADDTAPGITSQNFDIMKKNVANVGITFTQSANNLDVTMDEAKALSSAPELSKENVIAKIDEKDLKNAPLAVTIYAMSVPLTVTILTGVYAKDTSIDKLHITVYVIPKDGGKSQPCYSFDYTRDLYKKLDMNLSTNEFIDKTPSFAFSDYCKPILEKESKMLSAS